MNILPAKKDRQKYIVTDHMDYSIKLGPSSKQYKDNYDSIFRKKKTNEDKTNHRLGEIEESGSTVENREQTRKDESQRETTVSKRRANKKNTE